MRGKVNGKRSRIAVTEFQLSSLPIYEAADVTLL
jgi:hypothetical protein